MNREKVAGENFREGCMEVAFELWIEQRFEMLPVDSNGDSHRYQGKRYRNESRLDRLDAFCFVPASYRVQNDSEIRWYRGHVSP